MAIRRNAVADPNAAEANVRDILSRLRENADRDTAEVLTAGTNTFIAAMIRFRGNCVFNPGDVESMLDLWNILLNLGREAQVREFEFAPRGKAKAEPEVAEPPTEERRV